ncbi:MAG: hypothetical protein K5686_10865 [Lachnospiraceae bacterium]|nr:hypothetical protein [Lachnospiraceae bacterium]
MKYEEKLIVSDQVTEKLPEDTDTGVKLSGIKFEKNKLMLHKNGEATVTAYCGNKKASCKVTVVCYTSTISLINSDHEDVSDGKMEMKSGEQAFIKVSFDPYDSTDSRNVKWKSDNKKVSVKNGIITAKETSESVTAKITATVKATDPVSGKLADLSRTVTVNVKPLEVPKASAADKSHTLKLKKAVKMIAAEGSDTTELAISLTAKGKTDIVNVRILSVESSNNDVVSVNKLSSVTTDKNKGIATATLSAKTAGTAYILVKSTAGDGSVEIYSAARLLLPLRHQR